MSTSLELTASATYKQDWQVVRIVCVSVAHPGTINNGGIIEQGTFAVGRRAQPFQESRKKRDVVRIDLDQLCKAGRIVLMMRDRVMRVRNTKLREGSSTLFPANHKGDYTRQITLPRERIKVVHEHRMILEPGWNTGRLIDNR